MELRRNIFALVVLAVFVFSASAFSQDCGKEVSAKSSGTVETTEKKADDPVGTKVDGGMLYGKSVDPSTKTMTYTELVSGMSEANGNVVSVRGTVSEVCQAMGCWMTMSENGTTTRVKTLHEFFLPKDVAGREAVVTGKFNITEISEEDAKHFNEESSNPKDSKDIVGPQKAYEIEATGIVILDPSGK